MTEEIHKKANELHEQIADTQARLNIILDMRNSGNVLSLHDSEVGIVFIPSDYILKFDLLDAVEHAFTKELLKAQEEYKKL